jgi:predicted RNA-binding protein with EMAP domain
MNKNMTLVQLVKSVKEDIQNITEIKNNITGLISTDTLKEIEYNAQSLVNINDTEECMFIGCTFSEDYSNIENTKKIILLKTIEAIIEGQKRTISQTKKMILAEYK